MARFFVLVLVMLGLGIPSIGQQRYVNQWSIAAVGGINMNDGYFASVQIERYGKSASSSLFDLTMTRNNYVASDKYRFTVDQYFVGYKPSYNMQITRRMSLSLGAGAMVGYENPPVRTLENKVLKYPSKFTIGIDAAPMLEFTLSSKVAFYIQPRAMYVFMTNFENFLFSAGAGLKFYL